jgi:hypothetical protein
MFSDEEVAKAKERVMLKRALRLAGIPSDCLQNMDTFTLWIAYGKFCL